MQYLPSDPWANRGTVDNGPGAALAGIGNVFGDPMQNALQAQKQAMTARELAGSKQLGSIFAASGALNPANDAAAIANGMTPEQVFAAHGAAMLNGGLDSPVGNAALAAGGHFAGSPASQARAEAATAATAAATANTQAQSQLRVAGLEPVQIVNPDGSVGWTTKAAIATGHAPAGATPLVSPDMVKGALAGHNLLPQPGGGAVSPQLPDAAPAAAAPSPAPQGAPFDPSSPTASIASLLGSAMPQSGAPAPSGLVGAPPAPAPAPDTAPAANVGAPTADAMSDDQKQFLGLTAEPKFQVTGEDAFGNKQYGYPPAPGAAPAAPSGVATPAEANQALNLHGADFLKTLDPQTAGQVQSIIDGRTPYPTGMLLKTPYGQKLAAYVTQADPSFEAGNATARVKARQDFTSGGPNSVAGTIASGNTALEHLGTLSDQIAGLGNSDAKYGATLLNGVKNAAQGTGSAGSALSTYNDITPRLAEELTKFYRGTGGTEADVARDIAGLSPNLTPTQLHAALAATAKLVQGKVDAMQDRWHNAMGPLVPDFPLVGPKAQHALDTVMGRAGGAQGGLASPPAIPTLPGVTPPQPQGAFDGDAPKIGAVVPGKGGKNYVFKGGDRYDQSNYSLVPGQ